jgi:hypothetical protein
MRSKRDLSGLCSISKLGAAKMFYIETMGLEVLLSKSSTLLNSMTMQVSLALNGRELNRTPLEIRRFFSRCPPL